MHIYATVAGGRTFPLLIVGLIALLAIVQITRKAAPTERGQALADLVKKYGGKLQGSERLKGEHEGLEWTGYLHRKTTYSDDVYVQHVGVLTDLTLPLASLQPLHTLGSGQTYVRSAHEDRQVFLGHRLMTQDGDFAKLLAALAPLVAVHPRFAVRFEPSGFIYVYPPTPANTPGTSSPDDSWYPDQLEPALEFAYGLYRGLLEQGVERQVVKARKR